MKTKISTLLIMLLPFICFSQILWENFEDTRIGYYEFVHGGMTPRLDNPLPNAINNSELCAQYVRNPGETYDVIVLIANGPFFELTDYISGAKKMKVDVFSPAAGIPLQITLEDSAVAGATNYPDGRHSIYTATTTVANEWETVEFTFDSRPDNTVPDEDVTSLILLFDIGNNTGDTYYFDNLYGPEFDNQCTTVSDPNIDFADWDCDWNLRFCPSASACNSYDYISGWLNHAYNPDNTGINSSKYSGEYTRNPDPNGEDIIISYFSQGTLDVSINKYFNFKLYGPPRPIYISFQDINGNEVVGYNNAISTFNEWQQFTVDLSAFSSSSIERFVLFFDQGAVGVYDIYHLDDFCLTSIPLDVNDIKDSKELLAYPQPANKHLKIDFKFNDNAKKTLSLFDVNGKDVLFKEIPSNSNNLNLDVSQLEPGVYYIKLQSNTSVYTKQVQIIR